MKHAPAVAAAAVGLLIGSLATACVYGRYQIAANGPAAPSVINDDPAARRVWVLDRWTGRFRVFKPDGSFTETGAPP